ncbi:MAG: LuxR C-terminal-related transcriptional regulator [Eggerthellaceae bacterium]|nr:LuxR C-terminal-related transcriptional regulator [Eggerthellaceae bacterium]
MATRSETPPAPSVPEPSWRQTAQNELFQGWQRWLSFACIWIWSSLTTRIAFSNDSLQGLAGVLAVPNEITLMASAGVLLIILLASKAIGSIADSRFLSTLAGALLLGGSVFYVLGIILSLTWFLVLGMVGGGGAIAMLKIAWGEMYSRMELRRGLVCMGYALILSTVVTLLIAGLPDLYATVLLLASALCCAPLLFIGVRKLGNEPPPLVAKTRSIKFSASLLVLPAMVALSFGIIKGMMPWLEGAESALVDTSARYADLFVGIALILFAYKLGKNFGAARIYACALIFVVAGLILFSIQGSPLWVAFSVHEVGFALFYFFMIVYWGDLSRRTGMHIVRIYTIGYLTFQMLQTVGSAVGYVVEGGPSLNIGVLVILSVVLAFFVIVLILLSNSHSSLQQWLIADESQDEQGDDIPIACMAISREFQLSPREHEVLGLLARGRNASYVARTLFISLDTAKTHIKNIYRKLDIHNQQDLIDLIDTQPKPQG